MPRRPRWRGFYFITDAGLSLNGVIEDVRLAISAGIAMLQYREKRKRDLSEVLAEAGAIKRLCRAAGIPFLINDDVELALRIEADGAHVGQEDTPPEEARSQLGPSAIIGVSAGSVSEALKAEAAGADYVAVSPVFATSTKLDAGEGVGVEGVRAIRACTDLPLAAIGGISKDNVMGVIEAGADLICAISASLANGKVSENIRAMMRVSLLGDATYSRGRQDP